MFSGCFYALMAGFLASAASLAAKLSLGTDYLKLMCESRLQDRAPGSRTQGGPSPCDLFHVPLRLLCACLLLTCNTVMWNFFSKALHHCSSSARATVTTTASNFICSGILGRLIFGETHAVLWWTGLSLTLCGLLVLHGTTPQGQTQGHIKKDK